MDFPGGSDGKASAYNVGDSDSIPGLGRSPGEGNPVYLPWNSHGHRSLKGYSPWGCKRIRRDLATKTNKQQQKIQLQQAQKSILGEYEEAHRMKDKNVEPAPDVTEITFLREAMYEEN